MWACVWGVGVRVCRVCYADYITINKMILLAGENI